MGNISKERLLSDYNNFLGKGGSVFVPEGIGFSIKGDNSEQSREFFQAIKAYGAAFHDRGDKLDEKFPQLAVNAARDYTNGHTDSADVDAFVKKVQAHCGTELAAVKGLASEEELRSLAGAQSVSEGSKRNLFEDALASADDSLKALKAMFTVEPYSRAELSRICASQAKDKNHISKAYAACADPGNQAAK